MDVRQMLSLPRPCQQQQPCTMGWTPAAIYNVACPGMPSVQATRRARHIDARYQPVRPVARLFDCTAHTADLSPRRACMPAAWHTAATPPC